METKNDLQQFLEKFNIPTQTITNHLQNKQLQKIQNHIYLQPKNQPLLKNEISNENIIFIQLKYLSPTTHLLNFIKTNTENILKLKSDKRALDFTYGKDLFLDHITKPKNQKTLNENQYYIIEHNKQIIGYIQPNKNRLLNEFHIGDYLKENKN